MCFGISYFFICAKSNFAIGEQNNGNIDAKALKYALSAIGLLLAGGYSLSVAFDYADFVSKRTIPTSITDFAYVGFLYYFAFCS